MRATKLFPLFFVPLILITVIPTTTTTIAYAQISTPASASTNQTTTTNQTTNLPANITTSINQTASGGIQNMIQIADLLEPDIQRYDLVQTFNEVLYAFAYIQGNLTALQNYTTTITNNAVSMVSQAQADAAAARAELAALEDEEEPEPEAEDEEEPEEEEVEEEEEDTDPEPDTVEPSDEPTDRETNSQILQDLVNGGPRTDPEGDGGFPGDIDG